MLSRFPGITLRRMSQRLGVVTPGGEDLEWSRFRQRSLTLLAGAVAVGLFPGMFLALVADPLTAALVGVFSLALIAAGLFSVRGVLQVMRWLRR